MQAGTTYDKMQARHLRPSPDKGLNLLNLCHSSHIPELLLSPHFLASRCGRRINRQNNTLVLPHVTTPLKRPLPDTTYPIAPSTSMQARSMFTPPTSPFTAHKPHRPQNPSPPTSPSPPTKPLHRSQAPSPPTSHFSAPTPLTAHKPLQPLHKPLHRPQAPSPRDQARRHIA
nr:proline-rich extensin-like protein EPR1 [Penaeus vannamei]